MVKQVLCTSEIISTSNYEELHLYARNAYGEIRY